jgi:hypothetical protein
MWLKKFLLSDIKPDKAVKKLNTCKDLNNAPDMRRWLLQCESRPPRIRGPLGANFSGATARAAPRGRLIIAGGFRAAASRAGSRGLLELRGASRWRQKMAGRRSSGEITGHASGGVSGAAVAGLHRGGFGGLLVGGRISPRILGRRVASGSCEASRSLRGRLCEGFGGDFSPAVADIVGRHRRRFLEGRIDDGGGFCGPSRRFSAASRGRGRCGFSAMADG